VLPVKICWGYYPNRKGIVSGIIIGVFGLGSFTFNMISSNLINPNGLSPTGDLYPEEVYSRFPWALRILSGIWFGLSVIGFLFL